MPFVAPSVALQLPLTLQGQGRSLCTFVGRGSPSYQSEHVPSYMHCKGHLKTECLIEQPVKGVTVTHFGFSFVIIVDY